MTMIKRIPAELAKTPLQRHVRNWFNREARERDNGCTGVYEDLMQGGCSSGFVSHLIYHTDCVRFYRRHQREIDARLREVCEDSGSSPSELFERANWDDSDLLAREAGNQTILTWFGFEETARDLFQDAERRVQNAVGGTDADGEHDAA